MQKEQHIPVLYRECLDGLEIKPGGIYLDMTVGGFGHGRGICERLDENGIYIGFDLDRQAIERGRKLSENLRCKVLFVHRNFKEFASALDENGIDKIDGCLMDLGVSSFQLDEGIRGFSFSKDAPLDMRMDASAELSAETVVNTYAEDDLKQMIYRYGEDKFAPSIARSIVRERTVRPIETTLELVEAIKKGIPKKFWYQGKNPATKTFQAIRIEVNQELTGLFESIGEVIGHLNVGGRICVISFHSLEDRIVKNAFSEKSRGCDCPKELPVCVCGKTPQIKIITKTPLIPTEAEKEENIRSRSAKLRIAEKL